MLYEYIYVYLSLYKFKFRYLRQMGFTASPQKTSPCLGPQEVDVACCSGEPSSLCVRG